MSSVAGRRRPYWKGVTTTLCVDISESMATVETWGQVREFVGSFLQGENGTSLKLLSMHIYRSLCFIYISSLVCGDCIPLHAEYNSLTI